MINKKSEFAEKIKKYREKNGLSQRGFAKLAGISNGFACQLESGIRTPSYKTMLIIELLLSHQSYECCNICIFSKKLKTKNGIVIECRKNPPVHLPISGSQYDCERNVFKGYWPEVIPSSKCGEYTAKTSIEA